MCVEVLGGVVREAVRKQNTRGLSYMFCGAQSGSGARRCADKTSGVYKQNHK